MKNAEAPNTKIEDISLGFVMPIAKTDGYTDRHWSDVLSILESVATDLGIKQKRIVSDGDTITTIHSRIVNNLYSDEIIICDVSARNPNVMFELGMRIAFDKPIIIIKDSATEYCFDSGTIEHLSYPKDLRYSDIKSFKVKLQDKIVSTFETYIKNKSTTSPILKNFGSFEVGKIDIEELSSQDELIQDISLIKNSLTKLQMMINPLLEDKKSSFTESNSLNAKIVRSRRIIDIGDLSPEKVASIVSTLDREGVDYSIGNDKISVYPLTKSDLNIYVKIKNMLAN
ncbi:hypothetical protein [Klebsiella variicola]|uniref:hypothetical protein n=1 Tax=Klebsiella variicola TaxID=244366 RepID=UPI002B052FCD|nr:hypothetical protein [Klebsiella variicola]